MKPREGRKLAKWLFGKEVEIPETWNVVTLAGLSDGKPQYGSGDAALPYNPKLPRYIRITDIDDDGNLKNDECVSANLVNNEKNLLEPGDFLFARTGASVGRTLVFSKEFGRCIYAGYLIRFRLNERDVIPKFLHYCTHSASYWIWVTAELTHGVQPNINAQQYSKLPVLLPPLPEQRRIASILSGVDAEGCEVTLNVDCIKPARLQTACCACSHLGGLVHLETYACPFWFSVIFYDRRIHDCLCRVVVYRQNDILQFMIFFQLRILKLVLWHTGTGTCLECEST